MQLKAIKRLLTGTALLLVLAVPTFVPALHELLHAHKHHHCDASKSEQHLHNDEFACKLCDYLTTLVLYSDAAPIHSKISLPAAFNAFSVVTVLTDTQLGPTSLRGPPAIV